MIFSKAFASVPIQKLTLPTERLVKAGWDEITVPLEQISALRAGRVDSRSCHFKTPKFVHDAVARRFSIADTSVKSLHFKNGLPALSIFSGAALVFPSEAQAADGALLQAGMESADLFMQQLPLYIYYAYLAKIFFSHVLVAKSDDKGMFEKIKSLEVRPDPMMNVLSGVGSGFVFHFYILGMRLVTNLIIPADLVQQNVLLSSAMTLMLCHLAYHSLGGFLPKAVSTQSGKEGSEHSQDKRHVGISKKTEDTLMLAAKITQDTNRNSMLYSYITDNINVLNAQEFILIVQKLNNEYMVMSLAEKFIQEYPEISLNDVIAIVEIFHDEKRADKILIAIAESRSSLTEEEIRALDHAMGKSLESENSEVSVNDKISLQQSEAVLQQKIDALYDMSLDVKGDDVKRDAYIEVVRAVWMLDDRDQRRTHLLALVGEKTALIRTDSYRMAVIDEITRGVLNPLKEVRDDALWALLEWIKLTQPSTGTLREIRSAIRTHVAGKAHSDILNDMDDWLKVIPAKQSVKPGREPHKSSETDEVKRNRLAAAQSRKISQ